jgi:hypothetical protein
VRASILVPLAIAIVAAGAFIPVRPRQPPAYARTTSFPLRPPGASAFGSFLVAEAARDEGDGEERHWWSAAGTGERSAGSPTGTLRPSLAQVLSVRRRFAGLSAAVTPGDPPDPALGVGAGFVVQIVNSALEVWTTAGAELSFHPLASFVEAAGANVSDPRVVFDPASGRWFVSAVDVDRASVQIAVSAGSDPTGPWTVYSHTTGMCPDQPTLGIDGNLVVVGFGAFTVPCRSEVPPTYLGGALFVYDKQQLVDGGPAQVVDWGPRPGLSPIAAVAQAGAGDVAAVGLVMPPPAGGPTYVALLRLAAGTVSALVAGPTVTLLPIDPLTQPPPGGQARTSESIETNDVRILSAARDRDTLWLTGNDGCVPPHDVRLRSCLRVVAVRANRVRLDSDLGSAGHDFFYPALAPAAGGALVLVHGSSSGTSYPALSALALTAGGLETRAVTLAASTAPEHSDRFGDYFGAATDDTGRVWVTGETSAVGAGPNWTTTIALLATAGTPRG